VSALPNKQPDLSAPPESNTDAAANKPGLLFFYSATSGRCRLVEGYISAVLQRGKNHNAFRLLRVEGRARPDLFERFRISGVPTLLIVENQVVRRRLQMPRTAKEIEAFMSPWLKPRRRAEEP
jgi:thioredoxin-like negative regulator of GroEL